MEAEGDGEYSAEAARFFLERSDEGPRGPQSAQPTHKNLSAASSHLGTGAKRPLGRAAAGDQGGRGNLGCRVHRVDFGQEGRNLSRDSDTLTIFCCIIQPVY